MWLIDKIKDIYFNRDIQNLFCSINYDIENWNPKIKVYKYDKMFSLQKFLEREKEPADIIQRIMSSKSPFDEAKNLYNGNMSNINWKRIYYEQSNIGRKWISVWALRDTNPMTIFCGTLEYILNIIGDILGWSVRLNKVTNTYGAKKFLLHCKNNEYEKILGYFDNEILSCFALYHLKSNMLLTEILDMAMDNLNINCQHFNTACGNLYLNIGKIAVESIIYKVFESAYKVNKFSLKNLFFCADKHVNVEINTLKYDISIMDKDRGFFIPRKEHREQIEKDVLYLNNFLQQAHVLVDRFPVIHIYSDSITYKENYCVDDGEYFNMMFCRFEYKPNTSTGKAAKYPLKLMYYTNKEIFGEIYYLQNKNIGKVRIIAWHQGKCFIINCIDKKEGLAISKIETTKTNGKRETLFNINSK